MITADPKLQEFTPAIERTLARAAAGVTPLQFRDLVGDPGISILRSTKECVMADSISIWLADLEEKHLVVTHSDPDESFVGWKQPIGEGITSLAYAAQQSLTENQVYRNQDHSKRVDEARGQVTCSIIAVPFSYGGELQGVISCVKLKESPDAEDPTAFTARNMSRVRRLAKVLERLVNYHLLKSLLDLEI